MDADLGSITSFLKWRNFINEEDCEGKADHVEGYGLSILTASLLPGIAILGKNRPTSFVIELTRVQASLPLVVKVEPVEAFAYLEGND